MAFTVTVHHGPAFLVVEATGTALLGDLSGVLDLVAGTAECHGHKRVLLNLLGVDIDFGFTDHLTLGSQAASRLRELERVASVVPERLRVGTSEKAAQKMGLRLRTFTSLEDALRWIAE